jgi:SAM-dependent methyltransferase
MDQKSGNYRKYTSKNPLIRRATVGFLDDAISMIESLDVKTILDAGCGEGFVAMRQKDKKSFCMDISRSALDVARKNSPNSSFTRGDIYRIPFKTECFDLVMAFEVLEHLKYPEKVIVEVGRVSRQYCMFSVPNEPYFRAMNFMRGKYLRRLGNNPEHIQNWTAKDFVELVSRHYNVIGIRKPFPWTMVLCEK